jgi:AraC-like DNA-binding protein
MHLREGFEGQIQYVIPRQFLQDVVNHPLLYALFPTDIGWYPQARYHYRERSEGAAEHILIVCMAGEGWAEVAGKRVVVGPGQALMIPSGAPHVYGAATDPWSIHWVHFRGELAYQFARQLRPSQVVIPIDEQAQRPIAETFHECYQALGSEFSLKHMIFCALAIHRLLAWVFFHNAAFTPAGASMPPVIERALAFMRDHLHERPDLAMMAAHLGISVSHFSAQFKAALGAAPIDYFIDLKMQYACYLLETTELSVKQIAFALSYQDPYYFSRMFRKVIGRAPLHYRQQQRT